MVVGLLCGAEIALRLAGGYAPLGGAVQYSYSVHSKYCTMYSVQ